MRHYSIEERIDPKDGSSYFMTHLHHYEMTHEELEKQLGKDYQGFYLIAAGFLGSEGLYFAHRHHQISDDLRHKDHQATQKQVKKYAKTAAEIFPDTPTGKELITYGIEKAHITGVGGDWSKPKYRYHLISSVIRQVKTGIWNVPVYRTGK